MFANLVRTFRIRCFNGLGELRLERMNFNRVLVHNAAAAVSAYPTMRSSLQGTPRCRPLLTLHFDRG